VEKAHGRVEERILEATASLNAYLDWPGVGQVFRITRRCRRRGKESTEVVRGITSLSPAEADATRLLELSRGHWQVENRLHWVRDVDLREDECRVRHRGIAQILAALRNAIVRLLQVSGAQPLVAGIEYFAQHRDAAIDTLFKRIK
jgi:predicted transposase YbfD/YdcC